MTAIRCQCVFPNPAPDSRVYKVREVWLRFVSVIHCSSQFGCVVPKSLKQTRPESQLIIHVQSRRQTFPYGCIITYQLYHNISKIENNIDRVSFEKLFNFGSGY